MKTCLRFKYGFEVTPNFSLQVNYFLDDLKSRPGCAPLILIHFIDMCLMRETKTPDPNCNAYFFGPQHLIQQVLLIVALLCVPLLLLGTPLYENIANKKKKRRAQVCDLFSNSFSHILCLPPVKICFRQWAFLPRKIELHLVHIFS